MWYDRYEEVTVEYIKQLELSEIQVYKYSKDNDMSFDLALYSLLADILEEQQNEIH